jgi:hypothetical protein
MLFQYTVFLLQRPHFLFKILSPAYWAGPGGPAPVLELSFTVLVASLDGRQPPCYAAVFGHPKDICSGTIQMMLKPLLKA